MNFTEVAAIVKRDLEQRNALYLSPQLVRLNVSIPWHWLGECVPLSRILKAHGIRLLIDPLTEEIILVKTDSVDGSPLRSTPPQVVHIKFDPTQPAGGVDPAPPV